LDDGGDSADEAAEGAGTGAGAGAGAGLGLGGGVAAAGSPSRLEADDVRGLSTEMGRCACCGCGGETAVAKGLAEPVREIDAVTAAEEAVSGADAAVV